MMIAQPQMKNGKKAQNMLNIDRCGREASEKQLPIIE